MGKFAAFFVALTLFAALIPAGAATAVAFDDPVLEAALREAAGKPEGDVTDKDLAKITALNIERDWEESPDPATQVHSLAALAYCAKLTELRLNFHNIADITPLAGLTKLKTLEIGGNPIADVTPLAKLTALQTLALYNCQAADYSTLSRLKNLTRLHLDFSTIADLTPLAKLTKLKTLTLNSCPATDCAALAKLTDLNDLTLDNTAISDLTPLMKLTKLKSLSLKMTAVTDIAPLAKLTALRALYLEGSPIVDYAPIARVYAKLEQKDFDPSATREPVAFDDPVLERVLRKMLQRPQGAVYADELAAFTFVGTGLDYEQNPPEGTRVRSIAALRHCVNLTGLELNFNEIANVSPLAGLTNLTELELGGNPIADITPLAGLANLTTLMLFNAQAGDYSALSGLTNLKTLSLDFADITDLTPLANLTNLTSLQLRECAVADFTPIAGIVPNLREMNFDPNKPNVVIAFSDPMLEALIRGSLDKPEGNVTSQQAERISELGFERFGGTPPEDDIHDLSALRYCTGLRVLSLNYISATDLGPLTALTELNQLNLKGCGATDYSPLANLTNLTALNLDDSAISDVTPLMGMTKMEALSLRNTRVTDVAPLAGLTRLFGLTLLGAPVRDFSPLEAIYPSLGKRDFLVPQPGVVRFFDPLLEERVRGAMNKPEGDITPEEAAAVLVLDLSQDETLETSIESLQGLEAFTGLTKLSLSGNTRLTSLWPLAGMNLEKLNCWQCDVRSLEPLRGMTNLTELSLGWRGNIGSLDALSGLINLFALDAKGVGITDIGGLAGLPNLRYTGLNNNRIRDFSPLASCPALTEVELAGNLTEDYSTLAPIYDRLEIKDFTLDGAGQPADVSEEGDGWRYDAATLTLYVDSDSAMTDFQPQGDAPEKAHRNDAPWGAHLTKVERVEVSDAVARVGNYAFAFAGKLKKITIGRGVRSLGMRCLYRCGFESQEGLEIVIRCDEMPRLEEDFLGYTWDNPDTILVSPLAQAGQWLEALGTFPMRIAVK